MLSAILEKDMPKEKSSSLWCRIITPEQALPPTAFPLRSIPIGETGRNTAQTICDLTFP